MGAGKLDQKSPVANPVANSFGPVVPSRRRNLTLSGAENLSVTPVGPAAPRGKRMITPPSAMRGSLGSRPSSGSSGTDSPGSGDGIDGRVLLAEARQTLIDQQDWRPYVENVYSIDSGDYPFLTYVGLNFTESKIKNFKFYFSFFKRLNPDEVATLLPVADRRRFDDLYARWQPTKNYNLIHRGTTFALKVSLDGALTHYYHLRLPGRPMGEPVRMRLSPSDRSRQHGVCEEFADNKVSLKRYFYCSDRATILASLESAGFEDLSGELGNIDCLEYIESDQRDKMAWITPSRALLMALVERRGPPHLLEALEIFCRRSGFMPYGPGSARDASDHSIYFVLPNGPAAGAGYVFDGVRRFMTHFLHLT